MGQSSYLRKGSFRDVLWALLLSNLLSFGLLVVRVLEAGNGRYWFLSWNLMLGWLPLIFAGWLWWRLKSSLWLSRGNLVLTTLWLVFLPNSFYIASDLIHLHITGEVSVLYDAAMFMTFIFNSYAVGFMSIFLVHTELLKRMSRWSAHRLIALIFLICGFAIYLGRYLRWNTWDLFISPAGVLFDISERLINPLADPQVITTTLLFFLILSVMYIFIWQLVLAIRSSVRQK